MEPQVFAPGGVEGELVVLGVVAAHQYLKAIGGSEPQEICRLLALIPLLVVFQVALTLQLYEVESASGEAALNEIRAELKSQGYLKYYKQRDKRQKPADFLRFTSTDGFEILVGRNNVQNDKLTLHTARGKDLWFHVQKAPGSHVVVMSRGEEIPDTTKQEAAELAVIYSSTYKAGTGAKVAVDTTEVKNIWKASGAKPGMVLYEVYTTVYITPRDGLAEQLKKK